MDQLPRRLGLIDASLIVIGVVIGSSGAAMLTVWVVAGVLSYFGALAYAELGAMMPATGGQYVYLREAFGPGCAFLSGWVFLLAVIPGGLAFLAVGFSIYPDHFIPLSPALREIVSLALLAALSSLSYRGIGYALTPA
jgi:APA family basic amino acid/polyamine antiporter